MKIGIEQKLLKRILAMVLFNKLLKSIFSHQYAKHHLQVLKQQVALRESLEKNTKSNEELCTKLDEHLSVIKKTANRRA